jgi:quinol monooxygenase YgiN
MVRAMVTSSIGFRVLPHMRGEVLSAIDQLAERMRGFDGCMHSRLLADVEDQTAFTLASEWRDAAAARGFFDSPEFEPFRGIGILLREQPFIVIDEVNDRATRHVRAR